MSEPIQIVATGDVLRKVAPHLKIIHPSPEGNECFELIDKVEILWHHDFPAGSLSGITEVHFRAGGQDYRSTTRLGYDGHSFVAVNGSGPAGRVFITPRQLTKLWMYGPPKYLP